MTTHLERVTLDYDEISPTQFLKQISKVRSFFPQSSVRFRKSSSKTGYHVVVDSCCDSWFQSLYYRKLLGDCIKRVKLDIKRKLHNSSTQVLYDNKQKVKIINGRIKTKQILYATKWITLPPLFPNSIAKKKSETENSL